MSYNVPVRHLQGGSVLEVESSGTVKVASGGSVQVDSGGVVNIASGGSLVNAGEQSITGRITIPSGGSIHVASGGLVNVAAGGSVRAPSGGFSAAGTISIGGTVGRWAFGTTGFSAGVGTLATGLSRVVAFSANPILGEASGNGSISSFQIDLSLSASGSVIFRGVAGTLTPNLGGTLSWTAFGY